MPELPEVETTRRGVAPLLTGRRLERIEVRQPELRWPIPDTVEGLLPGRTLHAVERRGKYLLFRFDPADLIIHLGMSGSLRVLSDPPPAGKHDHVDFVFENVTLRLRDPRRFGAVLLGAPRAEAHPLLAGLGTEPLGPDFDGDYLFERAAGRRVAVKSFLMDAKVVVGVGNIYANEALFAAGIRPTRAAGRVARARYQRLAESVKATLQRAIEVGGTTLRDFADSAGQPGYFAQSLAVYGRAGECCLRCGGRLRDARVSQRATVWCPVCQR
ncbi:MAG: bifunctional DNA-formamidopyrimidine glycosylase/DNA-(apurinic or apyrimidinic site) lyase [Candidatus Dadabacteria bacterium]|nr:MAG: bifunctional DNA-formamidopyrimidine glycosylase/DNA-(apurinic or apyrimidinic site) lyase [Candidatus Dadabacteria bacterium]